MTKLPCATGSLFGAYLGNDDSRVFRPGITNRSQNTSVSEASISEFLEEGISFLGSGNSRKPTAFISAFLLTERCSQNQLSSIDQAAAAYDAGKFGEDLFAPWI